MGLPATTPSTRPSSHAGQINLTLNGGDGDDMIIGSAGNDLVNGGRGNDVALLGAGDDTFVWNPGDGSDTVEGQAGTDTLLFNGANVNENIDISANGGRVRFFRDVGNITMDLNGVETIHFNALGGTDTITVNDLTKTDVNQVNIDLASPDGGGDGQADTVIINATDGDDVIIVTNNNGVVTVSGLADDVTISGFEANDRIVINGLGGDDVIEASGLDRHAAHRQWRRRRRRPDRQPRQRHLNGGAGDDVLIGNGPGIDSSMADRQQRPDPGPRRQTAPAGVRSAEPVHGIELRSAGCWPGRNADRRSSSAQPPMLTQPHA